MGCLDLRLEIPKSLQKESAQTDQPRLRKHPKTVSVPPLGGGQTWSEGGEHHIFAYRDDIYPNLAQNNGFGP